MSWLLILAAISLVIGLINGILGLKNMRSKDHPQAQIRWQQPPLSPWRYETLTMGVISLHSLGLIGLTAFVVLGLAGQNVFRPFPGSLLSLLLTALAWMAAFFTAFLTGVMTAFHVAQPWIRPVSYGISSEGLYYGGMLIGWKCYSHYEVGPQDGLISLYSSYSPPIRSWVLQPPADSFASILGIIQRNLPSTPPDADSRSWKHSPLALIEGMLALVVGALIPAIWGWLRNGSWVWIYAFLAFLVVHFLGIRLITVFDGRGQETVPDTAS